MLAALRGYTQTQQWKIKNKDCAGIERAAPATMRLASDSDWLLINTRVQKGTHFKLKQGHFLYLPSKWQMFLSRFFISFLIE